MQRIAISAHRLEEYDLWKQIGFDSVILGWRDENRRERPGKVRAVGLYIENIHAPDVGADSIWIDGLDGDEYTNNLLQSIDDCKEFDIPIVVAHINNEFHHPPVSRIGIERLKRVTEKAERHNISIAFENTYAIDHIHAIFDAIPSNKLGFCFDAGHNHCMASNRDLLLEFGDRLLAMHLNDNFGADYIDPAQPLYEKGTSERGIQLDLHLLPFEGTIDWPSIARQLKQISFKGAIAYEGTALGTRTVEEFYTTAFERLQRIREMVNHEAKPRERTL
ncbi:MAG: sugar phosphate isomerase/epimerase [Defluviitaleaceae bacterium]|nr:sugar phosphate isomerase/epimerase [Defluviitaleaceae bacterium]